MKQLRLGFTLVEVLVVCGIVAALASVVFFVAQQSAERTRDNKRQADLQLLQAAVEAYRADKGRYPAGCNGSDQWSGELGGDYECEGGTQSHYIVALAPQYIPVLPRDPRRLTGAGYAYLTNAEGTVYKIVARGTVESEPVTTAHPMRSCDISARDQGSGGAVDITEAGWCASFCDDADCIDLVTPSLEPHPCNPDPGSDEGGNGATANTFATSFAVWGRFAPLRATERNPTLCLPGNKCVDEFADDPLQAFTGSPSPSDPEKHTLRMRAVSDTTNVICR